MIANRKSSSSKQMGASWVQVDVKEETPLVEGFVGARNWPTSTKAELLAIWCVVLIAPKGKKVRINTDSKAVIDSLSDKRRKKSRKQWIRETNYDLKRSIIELIDIKEIRLELVKVKGHSGNKWNL
jgi:ribonuclease HI